VDWLINHWLDSLQGTVDIVPRAQIIGHLGKVSTLQGGPERPVYAP
jgi:hypothetical protein